MPSNAQINKEINTLVSKNFSEDLTIHGHQAFLKGLQLAEAVITIQELDTDEIYAGIVKHSDATTISIRIDQVDGTYQTYVIFKHAIKKFWVDPKNQPIKLKKEISNGIH